MEIKSFMLLLIKSFSTENQLFSSWNVQHCARSLKQNKERAGTRTKKLYRRELLRTGKERQYIYCLATMQDLLPDIFTDMAIVL